MAGRASANLGVFLIGTFLYTLLYADDSLWGFARHHLGFVAGVAWVAMVPTAFGFALHKGLGVRWGGSVGAVVAAPAAAHAAIIAWHATGPLPPVFDYPATFYVMIGAQILFVHLGATLADAEPRLRGRRLGRP